MLPSPTTSTMIIASISWILFTASFCSQAAAFSLPPYHHTRGASARNLSQRTTAASPTAVWSNNNNFNNDTFQGNSAEQRNNSCSSRRRTLFVKTLLGTTASCAACLAGHPSPSHAFANAVDEAKKYADKPKRRGSPPKDLGLQTRTTEGTDGDAITSKRLRTCDGNPNCFSTTGDALLEDRQQYGVDYFLAPWMPSPEDESDPLAAIQSVMATYEPGQGGIDGGGFALIEKQGTHYLYYQFEAMKKGYIDDVEFAATDDTKGVQVRSASRVGVTDFGVNAVRLNYIAQRLRASRGWSIEEITPETHRDYWIAANEAREATFDADRRNMD